MDIKYVDRASGQLITEKPPAEGLMRFLYHNPFGKTAILPFAKQKWVSQWYGRKMDSPSSVSNIPEFISSQGIDMSESERDAGNFESFNDFFARKLKPAARPIGEGFVSPGDGKLLAFQKVSDVGSFFVKGNEFTVSSFLADKELAEQYQDASMFILRLAPNDYHRFHFPYGGIPSATTDIKGSYYSVSPIALARNFVRVFTMNKRAYCTLSTEDKGEVVLAPVGATMVGSIISTYEAGMEVRKGNEMGCFKFGGSSMLILVDSDKIRIDEDLLENTRQRMETAVKMGERIGI